MDRNQTLTGEYTPETHQPFRFVHPAEKVSPPIYVEGPKENLSFGARVMEFGFADNSRVFKIFLLVLVMATALYTKRYEGLFSDLIHAHVGGVLYVLFGCLAISLFFPYLHSGWAVSIAFVATCFLEFVQWLQVPFMVELTKNQAMAYLFGNSFSPKDFIYYGIGTVLSLVVLWLIREE
jgi:hypothetical protein